MVSSVWYGEFEQVLVADFLVSLNGVFKPLEVEVEPEFEISVGDFVQIKQPFELDEEVTRTRMKGVFLSFDVKSCRPSVSGLSHRWYQTGLNGVVTSV
jgi:hypothetical protein